MNDLRQGEGTVKYPNGKTIKAIWNYLIKKKRTIRWQGNELSQLI
jgi:hypothetical protein